MLHSKPSKFPDPVISPIERNAYHSGSYALVNVTSQVYEVRIALATEVDIDDALVGANLVE